MKNERLWYWLLAGMVTLLLAVCVIWFANSLGNGSDSTPDSDTSQGQKTTQPESNTTPGDTPVTKNQDGSTQPAKTYPVSVYFSKHPESDNDPSETFPVQRTATNLGLATFSLRELIKGPSAAESAQGYFTTIGFREGTASCASDFKLTIAEGTAKLQFCRPFDHRGVVADGQADSELKATLQQFDTVDKVIILNYRGDCEFDLSGENRCLPDPTR